MIPGCPLKILRKVSFRRHGQTVVPLCTEGSNLISISGPVPLPYTNPVNKKMTII